MPNFESFEMEVGKLGELEWVNVTLPGEDGDTWFVREKGGNGHIFRASLSGRERNSTPGGSISIQRDDFPDEVRKAVAIAIQRHLVCPGYELIERGKEHPVKVTCFDLYQAGVL